MIYITTADLIDQGINWTTAYLEDLINRSESVFNDLIWLKNWISLLSWSRTEELENIYNTYEIFLKFPNVTALTSINWVASAWFNYKILWQKIILEDSVSISDTFPNLLTIIYVAWYTTTPDDIRQVLYSLCSYFHNLKNSAWITSFSQDLLSVNYGAKEMYDYLSWMWQNQIINKYKNYYAYSL